jgi:SAM-dependent methyltransferase
MLQTTNPITAPAEMVASPIALSRRYPAALYLSVGLIAGALIALQLAIMRIFAVGSWAHFGSLVVSLAMLGFGLSSAILCIARPFIERHGTRIIAATLILFGPLIAGSNLLAQQLPFNAVFMLADAQQKWRLLANFLLYLLPFVAGAGFLGVIFIQNREGFGRVYFADLTGAGLCGLFFLLSMYWVPPEDQIVVPLLLGLAGAALWLGVYGTRCGCIGLAVAAALSAGFQYGLPYLLEIPALAVSDFKGVAYVRKFPDSTRIYRQSSPFGDLQIYASSYLHFAPGLSDNAAFNLPALPKNSYLGLYIDGDGPMGVIRDLPPQDTAYFGYLPMIYPYLIKKAPDTFIVQFGGGISTTMALRNNARTVTVAESNPAVLQAFLVDPELGAFTGYILNHLGLRIVDAEARLYLGSTEDRYDIVDLSLANSAGLSNPGGFTVVERFAYTREAMQSYMRALKPGGILSVTLWNKEDPPKSVLKLYATMVAAARALEGVDLAQSFFAVANYLSTTTVLYKRGGFTAGEIEKLRVHTAAMSFDEIYYPGISADPKGTVALLEAYRNQIFAADPQSRADQADIPVGSPPDAAVTLPATLMSRLAWHHLIRGSWSEVANEYVFDTRPLTDDRPYFAGYVKTRDLLRVSDRLELLQDEWGYLLLWATLAVAAFGALLLVGLPLTFGWRTIFFNFPGKFGTLLYFTCLGLGYIMVEIGLLSKFTLALSNYTISAAVVITGMLVFSGIGSFISERCLDRARATLPQLLTGIGGLLIAYAICLDAALDWIGGQPMPLRLICCFVLILFPALLMGFPMPIAMTMLARLGKDRIFVWAWGVNGCFSVVGAALVPIIATSFGLSANLAIAGCAYLIAIPAVSSVLATDTRPLTVDVKA